MAFNLSQFKSQMDWFGGPDRASLFEVELSGLPLTKSRAGSYDLKFFCKNVAIPGMIFNPAQYEAVGQMRKVYPMGFNPEPVQAIFLLDADKQVLTFFHGWAQSMVNFSTAGGAFSAVDGTKPFEINYRDDYACRMVIKHYSANYLQTGQYYEVILDKAFPIQMGDVDLAWENGDSFVVLPVSIQYDRIEFSGERYGYPIGGDGNSLLKLLTAAGRINDIMGGNILPTGVQDAVNKLTGINSEFDNISRKGRSLANQVGRFLGG